MGHLCRNCFSSECESTYNHTNCYATVSGQGGLRGSKLRGISRPVERTRSGLSKFLKIGALTFGGGIAMLALMQEQVVDQMHWLTSREFLDGLSLGQLTPGPTLMIAAYVGYKVAGITGAAVSALSMFLPAFILMLFVLPVLERFRHLRWIKPAMDGISAAVIGCLIVTLLQLLPHAAPDKPSLAALLITAIVLCRWRLPPLPLIVTAGLVGIAVQAMH